MTRRIDTERLLFLLHGDRSLFEQLRETSWLSRNVDVYSNEDAEVARVVGTLVHELEVNWAGVEVILRMRSELLATRRQVTDLLQLLRAQRGRREPR